MKIRLQLTVDALESFKHFVIQVYHHYYLQNDFTSFICRNRLRQLVLRITKKAKHVASGPLNRLYSIKVSASEFWALDNALKEIGLADLKPNIQVVVGEVFQQMTQKMMLHHMRTADPAGATTLSFHWQQADL